MATFVSALCAFTPPARAQTSLTYFVTERQEAYVDIASLPGAGPVTAIFTNFSTTLSRNQAIGFTFSFNNQTYTNMGVSVEGWLGLEPLGTTSSQPNNTPIQVDTPWGPTIAPFWDDLGNCTARTTLLGSAPNRIRVVQWNPFRRASGNAADAGSMQVWLYEGQSRFEVRYDGTLLSTNYAATAGFTGPAGFPRAAFRPCSDTANCTAADFATLAGRVFRVEGDRGPELVAESIRAPEFAFLGAEARVPVTFQSRHGNAMGPFTVAVVASTDPQLGNPQVIGTRSLSIQPFRRETVLVDIVPPSSLGERTVWLGLWVDSTNAIAEVDETNNLVAADTPTILLRGKPDLAVSHVRTDRRQVAAGDPITVFGRVRNAGGEPAHGAQVAVMLSTNPVISRQDVEIGRFSVDLDAGESVSSTTTVTVPPGTVSGSYYFGLLADPDGLIEELSESNNGRPAFLPVTVDGGVLTIATEQLPAGAPRVTYSALLRGTGGDPEQYRWSLESGRLPDGLGLVAASGELFGRPVTPECQTFTVRLDAGAMFASRELSLCINDISEPLVVATHALPTAVVGQEYAASLVAAGRGSTGALTWSAEGLPAGLGLSPEGVLGGTPSVIGTSTVTVSVEAEGERATRMMELQVVSSGVLAIVPQVLSTARLGEAYQAELRATGGVPPITWLVDQGRLPEGITLSTTGALSGTPSRVGVFRVVVQARDAGAPAGRATASIELQVIDASGAFAIVTETLPPAVLERGYEVAIRAEGGVPPLEWSVERGQLPEGLVSFVDPPSGELRIAGQASVLGSSTLLVRVRDAAGREARRALALEVVAAPPETVDPAPEPTGCGCRGADAEPSGWAVLALGLLGLRFARRRR